jgi:transcriptional regulator with XRE-family HTH domain
MSKPLHDNSILINAVFKLRTPKKPMKNKDIAADLHYSEGTISELMNGKKPLSKSFLRKFASFYKIEFEYDDKTKISSFNDPQEQYNSANAPRPDYLILAVLEKSLREQAALTQIQTQTAQIIKLIAAKLSV